MIEEEKYNYNKIARKVITSLHDNGVPYDEAIQVLHKIEEDIMTKMLAYKRYRKYSNPTPEELLKLCRFPPGYYPEYGEDD